MTLFEILYMSLFSLKQYLQEVDKYINSLREKFGTIRFEPIYTDFELGLYETYLQQLKMPNNDISMTAATTSKRGMVNICYFKYSI